MNRIISMCLFVMLSAFVWIPAYAQGDEPPIPDGPPQGTYILDTLNWLTSEQETEINALIQSLDQDGLVEIAIVTLDDCGTNKTQYRKSLLQAWRIGQANNDHGLLILVCWYGGDKSRRSVEQEFGSGMNGILSSDLTDRVAKENFVPMFQDARPGDGLVAMVRSYDTILRSPKTTPSPAQSTSTGFFDSAFLFPFIFCGVLPMSLIILFIRMIDKHSSHGGDYSGGGDFGGGDVGGDSGSSTSF